MPKRGNRKDKSIKEDNKIHSNSSLKKEEKGKNNKSFNKI